MKENNQSTFLNKLRKHFKDERKESNNISYLKDMIDRNCIKTFPINFEEIKNKMEERFNNEYSFENLLLSLEVKNDNKIKYLTLLKRSCLLAEYESKFPNYYYLTYLKAKKNAIIDVNQIDDDTKQILLEYLYHFIKRMVGPFFFIDNNLISYKEPIDMYSLDEYFINSSKGHFELFYEIRKPNMKEEYSMYPRGRVLYDTRNMIFKVYLDETLLNRKDIREMIINDFNLPLINVLFDTDEHYTVLDY